MFKKTLISLAVASSLGLTGCFDSAGSGKNASPDYKINNPAIDGNVYPRFNPIIADEFLDGGKALPIPNDLLFQQANPRATPAIKADGTFSDATSAAPSPAEVALGYLDGISTVAPIDLPFEGSIDPNSVDSRQFLESGAPNPGQNVFLVELAYPGSDPIDSVSFFVHKDADIIDGISSDELTPVEADAKINLTTGLPLTKSVEVPVPAIASGTVQPVDFRHKVLSLDGKENNYLRITPLEPLKPGTRYLVVVTDSITDPDGNKIAKDPLYQSVADPNAVLGNAGALAPVRDAALGWQALAEAYFGALTNRSRAGAGLEPLSRDNVALSFTATTGGTNAVLDAYANPASFFVANFNKEARQEAIEKLVKGQLTLSAVEAGTGFPSNSVAAEDQCVNNVLIGALTLNDQAPSYIAALDPSSASYDESITTFAQLPSNQQKAVVQTTVATVGAQAANNAGPCADGTSFAAEAAGTVAALEQSIDIPNPESQDSLFYTTPGAGTGPLPATSFGQPNAADVYLGQIELPYFLTVPSEGSAASDLATPWKANEIVGGAIDQSGDTPPTDRVTYRYPFIGGESGGTTVKAPIIVQAPTGTGTAGSGGNLPVVIYQHGIFGERGHSLALGNQLAQAGYVTIAIDLPLHGVAPFTADGNPNPLLGLSVDVDPIPGLDDLQERHFGYAVDQATQSLIKIQYGDDARGTSGGSFVNLRALQTSRDALRQAVVDLLNLNASIGDIDFDGDGTPDLDPSQVYFVGHSLGGIVGTTFVATNNKAVVSGVADLNPINAAALVTPGAGIARLLENSANISPTILGGLAKAGATQGSSDLELFLTVAQAAVDSADSINFAQGVVDLTTPVYLNEIYGDGSNPATQDQTIPVAADRAYAGDYTAPLGDALPAPLSGTEPLIMALEAGTITGNTAATATANNVVRFTAGTHTTIIKPEGQAGTAVFADMATNIATFFGSTGGSINFNNAGFVKQNEPTPENP